MSSVGLILGGGGITGAAYHLGALLAIHMATGWEPSRADVVVGTSGGATVAAVTRSGDLSVDSLMAGRSGKAEIIKALKQQVYRRSRPSGVLRWVRHGLLPGFRRPGLSIVLGSPAPYTAAGIAEFVEERIGAERARGWPTRPTLIVAYDLAARRRVAFGTDESPDVALKLAVAASSAVPVLYEPVAIAGRDYIDGGVASGTNLDLVLGSADPLDLIVVLAPMAMEEHRQGAIFYEELLDKAGRDALGAEMARVRAAWPDTEILVMRPTERVLDSMRPNPLSVKAAVPAFLATLRSMQEELARPEVWSLLEDHLLQHDHVVPGV